MKSERIILSFVAIVIGLVVAGIAFYFYQMTKTISDPESQTAIQSTEVPTPTPDGNLFLSIQEPKNEEVVSNRTIRISGKTLADATVIVSTESDDSVVKPAKNGDFTVTKTITDGANVIRVTAIFPNGEERTELRTVTYSTENF